jgi:SWI/SNF-related matrix-associated actin-dependent regulator 1 of chromatin subfamily A
MQPRLVRKDNLFVFESSYDYRLTAKNAGFRWAPDPKKYWYTESVEIARKLQMYADEEVKAEIEKATQVIEDAIAKSRATSSDMVIPAPEGRDYLPFQKAGIEFASQKGSVLIGDEMGLGKTIQAIGLINLDETIKSVLVVCPASLKINWRNELSGWLTRLYSIEIAKTQKIIKKTVVRLPFPTADIVIVNYDILHNFQDEIRAREWDLLICDEAHYLKNGRIKRTQQVLGKPTPYHPGQWDIVPISAKRRIFLTGTPIVNKPIELWPLISALDPEEWDNFGDYSHRYCNAHRGRFGWDMNGAKNLGELQNRLRRTVLLRRTKTEVLTDLPAKVRQVVELPQDGARKVIEAEKKAFFQYQAALHELKVTVELSKASEHKRDYAVAVERLKEGVCLAFGEMAKARRETAVAKIPYVIEFIENVSEKVVIFAHHRDAISQLKQHLGNRAVVLDGSTSMTARNKAVEQFQNDPNIQYFIGSIQAAGVGLTLTAASHVIFAELDWVPGNVCQAEDRCVLEGQLVMTKEGLVPIEKIPVGMEVLTHYGNWKSVIATRNRQHRGLFTEISYQRFGKPLIVTHDHKIWVQRNGVWEWMEAHNIIPGDMLAFQVKSNHKSFESIAIEEAWKVGKDFVGSNGLQSNGRYLPLPNPFPWSKKLAYVMGYYLANGFSSIATNKGRFVSFAGHDKKLPILHSIKEFLESHGISVSEPRKGSEHGNEIRAYSGELAMWFRDWFGHGAKNKKINRKLMDLSIEDSIELLRGYIDGDGYCRKNQEEWVSISRNLASQMTILAKKCGYNPTLREVNNESNSRQWVGGFTVNDSFSEISLQKVLEIKTNYAKKTNDIYPRVYDLTVEDDHSFVVGLASVHNCHRIGQKNSVLVQHLVFNESIDANMAKTLVRKQAIIDAALDDPEIEVPVTPEDEPAATADTTWKKIEQEAKDISPRTIEAIHSALRYLSNLCDGALQQDGMGFNSYDSSIGKSLASQDKLTPKQATLGRKVLRKYSKQLGPQIMEAIND